MAMAQPPSGLARSEPEHSWRGFKVYLPPEAAQNAESIKVLRQVTLHDLLRTGILYFLEQAIQNPTLLERVPKPQFNGRPRDPSVPPRTKPHSTPVVAHCKLCTAEYPTLQWRNGKLKRVFCEAHQTEPERSAWKRERTLTCPACAMPFNLGPGEKRLIDGRVRLCKPCWSAKRYQPPPEA